MMRLLKKLLPWLITLAIFFYLSKQIHPQELAQALQLAHIPTFILYACLYFVLVYLIDVIALWYFLNRFATKISLSECVWLRGATYLIMILNYNAGQGAMPIYLRKTHNAPIAKTLGTVAFITAADLILVIASAFVVLSFHDHPTASLPLKNAARLLLPGILLAYLLWVGFWNRIGNQTPEPQAKSFLQRFLRHDTFHTYREAKLTDHIILFALRLPLLIIVIGAYNCALFSFESQLPWTEIFLYNPIVMLVSALPITPAGLGTSQMLVIQFFKNSLQSPWIQSGISAENLLLTSSLLWFLANQVLKAITGAICLNRSSRSLFEESNNTTQDNH